MARALHIIVTCSSRKRLCVEANLRAARLPTGPVAMRAGAWAARMSDTSAPRVPVRDLYCGEHWQLSLQLPAQAASRGWAPTLWVASAGLGLLQLSELVPSYAATFAPYELDAVAKSPAEAVEWWNWLCTRRMRAGLAPSSIAHLVSTDRDADYLVVLSAPYLDALEEDLGRAVENLNRPNSLTVICSGAQATTRDRGYLVRPSARLQAVLGGARQVLNVRTAGWLLGHLCPDSFHASDAAAMVRELTASAPELLKHNRRPLNDDELCARIDARRDQIPKITASRLLRELRDHGFACEQKRFGRLFRVASQGAAHVS